MSLRSSLSSLGNISKSSKSKNRKKRFVSYWREKRRMCKNIIINDHVSELDSRPHVTILVLGSKITGLLDSGATDSFLGKNSLEFLKSKDVDFHRLGCFVKTADGSPNKVEGYVYLNVRYDKVEKVVKFFVVPTLDIELYLGMTFWAAFNIVPMMRISELVVSEQLNCVDKKLHVLSEDQALVLDEIKNLFPSFNKSGLGRTSMYEFEIDVGNASPIKQRFYPISPAIQKDLYDELDRMLELDVIEESQSSWSSPITLVRKPNGAVRLCLDARKVNSVTISDAYPLPLIDGLLSRFKSTRFISSLDLKDAFWQVPLAKTSRDKTAFTVPGRPLYQFKVMPFGLRNAAQGMTRLMDKVIPYQLHEQIFVYLDDLLIVSETFEEHMTLLRTVAERLSKAKLTVNIEKSKFLMREIKYVGYIVGESGLKPDPSKVEGIMNFPPPKTVKQIRRVMGMANWYRRFIPNFADVTAPITNLTKKGVKFCWNSDAEIAFDKLKTLLSTAPVLVNPNFEKMFIIRCDASMEGIGGVLCQHDDEGCERPIAYFSQKLNRAQKNYNVTELECLAAVLSVKKFRPYIEGYHFKIITDHASLRWLMSQKDLSGRLARWSMKLQSFDFEIEHQRASENVVPDALSRIFCDSLSAFLSDLSMHFDHIDPNSNENTDSEYQNLKTKIFKNPDQFPNLRIHNDRIYIHIDPKISDSLSDLPSWKLWLPKPLARKTIEEEHDAPGAAHGGIKKTLDRIRRLYYWPGMAKEVYKYVNECEVCKTTKPSNKILKPPMGDLDLSARPWQRIYIDFLGPYPRSKTGKTCILIALDQLTKFVVLKAFPKASASNTVNFLKNDIFNVFGVPERIRSDNGGQFISKEFKALLNEFGILNDRTAFYSPQSNASERVNRSIICAIRAYLGEINHRSWDTHLSDIASALRNSVHQSTQYSPHFLMFGFHKVNHADTYKLLREISCLNESEIEILPVHLRMPLVHTKVLEHLKLAYEANKKTYNLRSRPVTYNIGDEVYVRQHILSNAVQHISGKLAPQWKKAVVVARQGSVMYILKDLQGKPIGTYHAKDLKV